MHRLPVRICLALLCAASSWAWADPGWSLDLEPAWNGVYRPGAATEVTVRITSPGAAVATLTLSERDLPDQKAVHTVRLDGSPAAVSVPVARTGAGELRATLDAPGQVALLDVTLIPAVAGIPVVALAGRLPGFTLSEARLIHVDPANLPVFADAYAVIDLLIMTGESASRLDTSQRAALQHYLAGCGRLVIQGAHASDLTEAAGCHGQMVSNAPTPAAVGAAVVALLERQQRAPPSAHELRQLLDTHDRSRLTPAAFALCLYLAISLSLAFRRAPLAGLAAAPIVATVVVFATWSGGGHNINSMTWTEVTSGAQAALQSSFVRVSGEGYGSVRFDIPGRTLPRPFARDGVHTGSTVLEPAQGAVTVAFPVKWLELRDFTLSKGVPVEAPLELRGGFDPPTVTNPQPVATPAAQLAWNGGKYRVPPLAPGQTWRPDPASRRPWGNAAAERLFRARSMAEPAALLLEVSASAGAAAGFLMVRP